MARAAVPGRLSWQVATVAEMRNETATARSFMVEVPDWPGHLPGQHVDLRLTDPDGYMAQRSYSIASAPEDPRLELTVERVDDGEVSTFLTEDLRNGDALELRGPIGGYFVWEAALGGPLLLIAGGSGIVPLRAILRHRIASGSDVPVRLLYSVRTPADVIYRDELSRMTEGVDLRFTYTREAPAGWTGYRGRITGDLLQEVAWPAAQQPRIYVCGPTEFVELAGRTLVHLGHDPLRIRLERFG
jgi:ferredoxin-NADP reductase